MYAPTKIDTDAPIPSTFLTFLVFLHEKIIAHRADLFSCPPLGPKNEHVLGHCWESNPGSLALGA